MVKEEAPRIGGERATDITLLLLPTGASSGPCPAVVDGATERSGSRTDQQLQQHNYYRSYRAHQNQQMCQKSLFLSSPSFIHSFLLSLLPSLPLPPSLAGSFFFFKKIKSSLFFFLPPLKHQFSNVKPPARSKIQLPNFLTACLPYGGLTPKTSIRLLHIKRQTLTSSAKTFPNTHSLHCCKCIFS